MAKSPTASARDTRDSGLIPGSGRSPGEGNGNPLWYFLPGKFHGQRSLVGYSPWGHKESDTTECAHAHTHTTASMEYNKQQYICTPIDTGKQS